MPSDPTLYLYTSLTSGSRDVITGTSRIEGILKANKIPFRAVDCATDEKARLLWARRSKGKKLPGLVKFNDIIADLEQVEDWNEHGELEDQIEDAIDIFGDVPISATTAEAQAADAARREQQRQQAAGGSAQARTASETRHISISEPGRHDSDARKPSQSEGKTDSPLNMAMRQAGAEAAKKAGEKKDASKPALMPTSSEAQVLNEERNKAAETNGTSKPTLIPTPSESQVVNEQRNKAMPPPDVPASAATGLDPDAEDVSKVETGAKMPGQLAAQGATKTTTDKMESVGKSLSEQDEAPSTGMSNAEQIMSKRRESSQPTTRSSLSKTTSIDQSHTVADTTSKSSTGKDGIEEEEDDDDDEAGQAGQPAQKAAKISATSEEEEKVLKGTRPQEGDAKDGDEASTSVGD